MAGCTADPGAEPGPFGENPPTAENPHAVPVEQALEELQSVLEEICSAKGYKIDPARPAKWPAAGEIVACLLYTSPSPRDS